MAKLVVCLSQVPILVSETSREDAGLGQCGWNPQGMNSGLASLCFYSGWPFKSVLHGDKSLLTAWGPLNCGGALPSVRKGGSMSSEGWPGSLLVPSLHPGYSVSTWNLRACWCPTPQGGIGEIKFGAQREK